MSAGYAQTNNRTDFAVIRLSTTGTTTDLFSSSGLKFDVDTRQFATGELIQGPSNAFDGLNRLIVGTSHFSPVFDSTTADGGHSIQSSVTTLDGLDVQREVSVPTTGSLDFARIVDTFTNNTLDLIETTVTIVGNLGSDAATIGSIALIAWLV